MWAVWQKKLKTRLVQSDQRNLKQDVCSLVKETDHKACVVWQKKLKTRREHSGKRKCKQDVWNLKKVGNNKTYVVWQKEKPDTNT
jgi:hypothetical protein